MKKQTTTENQREFTDNINEPCKLCRKESMSVTSGKYCNTCYKELLTNLFLHR